MIVGKTSFPDQQLLENYQAVIEELIRAKPSAAKGKYLRTITMASSQGPGVKIDPARTRDLVEGRMTSPSRARVGALAQATASRRIRFSRDPRRLRKPGTGGAV